MRIDYQCQNVPGGLQMTAYLIVGAGRRIPKGTMVFVGISPAIQANNIANELNSNPLLL